jgi:hypothetical protein
MDEFQVTMSYGQYYVHRRFHSEVIHGRGASVCLFEMLNDLDLHPDKFRERAKLKKEYWTSIFADDLM